MFTFTTNLPHGRTLLAGIPSGDSPLAVLDYMLAPIMKGMEICLTSRGRQDLIPELPRYVAFRMGLGMVQPRRVDDVWDKESIAYNPYLPNLRARHVFYTLNRLATPVTQALIQLCVQHWQAAWQPGAVMTGDEPVVPHKGLLAAWIRQFIPRKPHPIGIKLYYLVDAQDL